eukprot:scaffold71299_cov48-Phaeocystis_antarctica.AAC.1
MILLQQQKSLVSQCSVLLVAVVVFGLYDLLTYYFALRATDISYGASRARVRARARSTVRRPLATAAASPNPSPSPSPSS